MSDRIDGHSEIQDRIIRTVWAMAGTTFILLTGCTQKIAMPVTNPSNYPGVAELKTLAVYPFEGRNGNIYRAEVESLLVSANVNGKRSFSVVESAKLDSIIKAQRMGSLYDETTVAEVGRLTGARGIVMGTITTDTIDDSRYSVNVQKCSYTDKDGKCKRWRDAKIPCTRRTANVGFTIRVVNVESGVQPYNRDVSGQAVSQSCNGDGKVLENRAAVSKRARQAAYDEVRKDVAPYTVNLNVKLMSDTDGIDSDRAKQELESGLSFAKAGRMDRACELWKAARTRAPGAVAILYNIGVCAEVAGELNSALALYQEADRALLKPEPVINEALQRVQERLNSAPVGL